MNKTHFDDEEVEGKVHEVDVDNEQDMLVYACYISECITFKRPTTDFKSKGLKFLRNKIVDAIISLTYI
jgi:hypothetical protein